MYVFLTFNCEKLCNCWQNFFIGTPLQDIFQTWPQLEWPNFHVARLTRGCFRLSWACSVSPGVGGGDTQVGLNLFPWNWISAESSWAAGDIRHLTLVSALLSPEMVQVALWVKRWMTKFWNKTVQNVKDFQGCSSSFWLKSAFFILTRKSESLKMWYNKLNVPNFK